MGMDVIGNNPSTEKGDYFRNNVWWWRPLWDYCVELAPELCGDVSGHYNDGDGLDGEGSVKLAEILNNEIKSGRTAEYEQERNEALAQLPRVDCNLCSTTGIRTDEVGMEHGMHDKQLDPEVAIQVGREFGWCNGCNGIGTKKDFDTQYPFSVENVQEFADFLSDCGGFGIH
jgi:hypothetical protein